MSCGVGCRCNLDPLLLWLWCRLAAAALIGPIAWEIPYASGAALKSKIKREIRFVVTIGGSLGEGNLDEGCQNIWTSSYKVAKYRGCNVQRDYIIDTAVCSTWEWILRVLITRKKKIFFFFLWPHWGIWKFPVRSWIGATAWQPQILNPLSQARDQTHILTETMSCP